MPLALANRFRLALAADLRDKAAGDPQLHDFADAAQGLAFANPVGTAATSRPPLVDAHLTALLDGLACAPSLAEALRAFAPSTYWYQILKGADVAPSLEQGLMVGRPDFAAGQTAYLGLFLIAPHVHYPLHQHSAHEVYYPVSGRIEIQHGLDTPPFMVEAGHYSVTPPHRLHALSTGDTPCLMAYVWRGEIFGPSWWWEQAADGAWSRVKWVRQANGIWDKQAMEPLSTAEVTAAR